MKMLPQWAHEIPSIVVVEGILCRRSILLPVTANTLTLDEPSSAIARYRPFGVNDTDCGEVELEGNAYEVALLNAPPAPTVNTVASYLIEHYP